MQEELVNFQVAKLAKEKGFGLKVKNWFDTGWHPFIKKNPIEWESSIFVDFNSGKTNEFSRPTQSLLQRWLRGVHNIRVLIDFETIDDSETAYTFKIVRDIPEGKGRKKDTWDFYDTTYSFNQGGGWYKTYEEALELGLIEGLKLIK